MVRVKSVLPSSIAEELGIAPGTELLTVNGRELNDFLDWEFLTADEELIIEAKQPDGEAVVYEVGMPERRSARPQAHAADGPSLRDPLRVLLHRGFADRAAQAALCPRRRLPFVV